MTPSTAIVERINGLLESTITPEQRTAVARIGELTRGSYDIWRLAGPHASAERAALMTALTGKKTPKAKAGVTAMIAFLNDLAGVTGKGTCISDREEMFAEWAKSITATSEAKSAGSPYFKVEQVMYANGNPAKPSRFRIIHTASSAPHLPEPGMRVMVVKSKAAAKAAIAELSALDIDWSKNMYGEDGLYAKCEPVLIKYHVRGRE